jgi:pilus assembly protein CpaB
VAQKETDILQQLRQNRLVLLVGILCGIAGAVLIYFYLTGKEKEYSVRVEVVSIAQEIAQGDMITVKHLRRKSVPQRFVIPNAIPWQEYETIQGTKAQVNLKKGQIVTWDFIEVTTLKRTFSDKLDSTQRAITMQVDEYSGVAGNIMPGDRVDVIGIFTLPGRKGMKTVSKTIIQCVPVLSVGYRGARMQQSYNSITLQVSPLEAELLYFAESQANLKYVLRNRENIGIEEIEMVDFGNLEVVKNKTTRRKKLRVRYADERRK